jgi:hypothetical protein
MPSQVTKRRTTQLVSVRQIDKLFAVIAWYRRSCEQSLAVGRVACSGLNTESCELAG